MGIVHHAIAVGVGFLGRGRELVVRIIKALRVHVFIQKRHDDEIESARIFHPFDESFVVKRAICFDKVVGSVVIDVEPVILLRQRVQIDLFARENLFRKHRREIRGNFVDLALENFVTGGTEIGIQIDVRTLHLNDIARIVRISIFLANPLHFEDSFKLAANVATNQIDETVVAVTRLVVRNARIARILEILRKDDGGGGHVGAYRSERQPRFCAFTNGVEHVVAIDRVRVGRRRHRVEIQIGVQPQVVEELAGERRRIGVGRAQKTLEHRQGVRRILPGPSVLIREVRVVRIPRRIAVNLLTERVV